MFEIALGNLGNIEFLSSTQVFTRKNMEVENIDFGKILSYSLLEKINKILFKKNK